MHTVRLLLIFLTALSVDLSAFAQKTNRTLGEREKPLVDIDIGGASGNYNGQSYSEVNLGVNLNFTDWLTLRNSAFKRFGTKDNDITGLDSTLRLILTEKFDSATFRLFGGAGYRFADPSEKNALIGEGGLGFNFGRLGLGAGAKYLKYDKLQYDFTGKPTKGDDINFFFVVSAGAGLSF